MHVVKPLMRLHTAGRISARISIETLASASAVRKTDVAIFCRNLEPRGQRLLDAAIAAEIPVLYDLDDNFFLLPEGSSAAQTYGRPECLAMLEEYLAAADLVRVYSRPLYDRALKFNANVEIVRGVVDLKLVDKAAGRVGPASRRAPARQGDPLRIVYATSRLDDTLCQIFTPALARLQAERPGRIEVHFWGPRPPAELKGARHQAMVHDYDRYLQSLAAAQFDIGLAPLANDLFHRSKTDTKFREYGACGTAGIYSAVDVYRAVQDGRTGLLAANTTEAWRDALVQLIDDTTLRASIARQARSYVEEHYSTDSFDEILLRQIMTLAEVRPLPKVKTHIGVMRKSISQPNSIFRRTLSASISFYTRVRSNRVDRTWNSFRWMITSCWKLAIVKYLLLRSGKPPEEKVEVLHRIS